MSEHKQCSICGRVGTRAYTRMGSGWICTAARTCWNRRRGEQSELRQAIAQLRSKPESAP